MRGADVQIRLSRGRRQNGAHSLPKTSMELKLLGGNKNG